jgi:uncharacterized alkaline shock family protein YloU
MSKQGEGAIGRIEVSPHAVATVVAEAVARCYGVVGMAHRELPRGLETILRRNHMPRGIRVRQRAGRLTIEVFIMVEYGTRIREVGRNVAESIQFAVQGSLGVPVEQVIVNIQDLRFSDET